MLLTGEGVDEGNSSRAIKEDDSVRVGLLRAKSEGFLKALVMRFAITRGEPKAALEAAFFRVD